MKDLIFKQSALLVLIAVGLAGAAETFTDTYYFRRSGLLRDYESDACTDNTSAAWTHALDGFDESCSITEATLTISGCGIKNVWWDFDRDGGYEQLDYVAVQFMGQDLGLLTGNSTTFDLLPYQNLIAAVTNASAELSFQNDLTLTGRRGDCVVDFGL